MIILFYSGLILLFLIIIYSVLLIRGCNQLKSLKEYSSDIDKDFPSVSVIIPALNEEDTIRPALESVLNLEYPNLEIIVINDRSTDRTGKILDSMVIEYPKLKVYHKADLPSGWLGKNHALQFGAEKSKGDYLLFTDADVIMEKKSLIRAMNCIKTGVLDHLAVIFDPVPQGALLNSVILQVMSALMLIIRPWKADSDDGNGFVGVGAYNLVKKSVYMEIGMHEKIAMYPADDLMLGKMIKRNGFKQVGLISGGNISVKWYGTVSEIIKGTEKNIFSVVNFNVLLFLLLISVSFIVNIMPLWIVIFFPITFTYPFLMVIILRILLVAYLARPGVLNSWNALLVPVSDYILLYMIINSTIKTIKNKGITWRGTFYSIKELRSNCKMKLYD
ncbi:glycosyltransferase family 2 protein [bacterium]|nr:glycosyltransferase family 2 protein [bacterium]